MSTATDPTAGEGLAWLIILLTVYFAPAIVASIRRHRHAGAVFVLNLFLGWTLLGWVVAPVWAAMNQRRESPAPRPMAPATPSPPAADAPAPTGDVRRTYPSLDRYYRAADAGRTAGKSSDGASAWGRKPLLVIAAIFAVLVGAGYLTADGERGGSVRMMPQWINKMALLGAHNKTGCL